MVQHHQVVLPADTRLLVPAECRVRRVGVVLVHPHATGLDRAPGAVRHRTVARPHTRTEAVDRVVRNPDRLAEIGERGHRQHRPEDFFLEDGHVVGALEHRRLNIEASFQALDAVDVAPGERLRTLLRTELEVAGDLAHLLLRRLSAHLHVRIQGVAGLDLLDPLYPEGEKLVGDGFVHQRP